MFSGEKKGEIQNEDLHFAGISDGAVIGYFTNKTALQKAIAQNWATLGGYQKRDFCREFYNRFYRNDIFSNPDKYLECGEIEVANANEF